MKVNSYLKRNKVTPFKLSFSKEDEILNLHLLLYFLEH